MNLFGVWKRRAIAFYKASPPKIYLSIFFTLQKLEVGPFMRSPTSVLSKGIFKGLSCDQDTARLYVPYMPPSSMRFSPSSYIVALVSLVKDPCLVLTTLHRWCWGLAWGWAEFHASDVSVRGVVRGGSVDWWLQYLDYTGSTLLHCRPHLCLLNIIISADVV